mgnify:FL=1
MPNRLQFEKSEYLLQHKDNPVDWYPWGNDAFQKAKEDDKPIFLSIGYSACHWCHVMEEESFVDEEIANFLNKNFVSIKVDREERPDVDSIYMTSVQIIAGHGGWPMSSFLTPDGKPFFAGTYFPKVARQGMPGFLEVLQKITLLYGTKRNDVEKSSIEITDVLKKQFQKSEEVAETEESQVRLYIQNQLEKEFDVDNAGFSKAPKFPQPILHEFVLNQWHKNKDESFLKLTTDTLDAMEMGGIHDQVGGGFHRYSVDDKWLVPHFEKMLYDNASLAYLYLNAFRITKNEKYKKTTEKTLDYLSKEMISKEGGVYAAQDADSEGVEGKFFVWDKEEIEKILNNEEADKIIKYFNVTDEGNFEGKNILNKSKDILSQDEPLIQTALSKLYVARSKRIAPNTDKKIITSWNSMAIKVFAKAGVIFDNKNYLNTAIKATENILKNNTLNGKIQRVSYDGNPSEIHGMLEDYSFFVQALIELNESTGDNKWMNYAIEYADKMIDEFWSEEDKMFYDSGTSSTDTLVRASASQDNITASGISVACEVLVKLSRILNEKRYEEIVDNQIESTSAEIAKFPAAHCNWAKLLGENTYNEQLVLAGKDLNEFLVISNSIYNPNLVFGFNNDNNEYFINKDKNMIDGKPTAYICKNYTCKEPLNSSTKLLNNLSDL